VSQFGPHLHSPFGPHLHISNSTGKNSAFTQPIYQNNNSSPEVTIINYNPNYNLISIASQHHHTRIMDHIQFFPCIRTSNITLQDQRQQNGPETTKDRFHQEYEPAAATKEANNSFSPPISFDESVVASYLASHDYFFSARLLFSSNCHFTL